MYRSFSSACFPLKTPDPKSARNAPEKQKSRATNTRRLKNAEWVQGFFFISNFRGVCGAYSWDIETRPRAPVFGSAREMFCLVERQACRKTSFVDGWADWVKPFFERRLFVFVSCVLFKTPKEEFDSISIPSHFKM
jgi:hypothetical protein